MGCKTLLLIAMLLQNMIVTRSPLNVSVALDVSHRSTHVKRCAMCRPLRGPKTSCALVHMPGHERMWCNCTGDQELIPLLMLVCNAEVGHHNGRCAGLWLSNSGRRAPQPP